MEKRVIDRRLELLRAEGIELRTSVDVGANVAVGRAAAAWTRWS